MFLLRINILYLSTTIIYGLNLQRNSKSTYQNCKMEQNHRKLDVLPGTGWDNLANLKMGRVLDLNFSKCLYSDDNLYLIPNQLSLTSEKKYSLELRSETIDHFMNYTSVTSKSINVDGDVTFGRFKFGGSFSDENRLIKTYQLETKLMLTRVQLRYNVYESMFEPETPLFPTFKDRIIDIAGMVVQNKDTIYPEYLSDMIIRDYGTHVIRSIKAGAVLLKTDAIASSYANHFSSEKTKISASASASFLGFYNIKTNFNTKASNDEINEYNKKCVKTHIEQIGGKRLVSNFSLENWEESILDNLAPIDRRGEPIYHVVTPRAIPELDDDTVNKVYGLLKDAVQRYYTRNARTGCLDIFSPNFNSDANIDSGSCLTPKHNFTMGGVFQKCTGPSDQCDGYDQVNPLTGMYSCPSEFTSIMLNRGLHQCKKYCSGAWFWAYCKKICSTFNMYWCCPQADRPNHGGYQFGGFISKAMLVCPQDFVALKLGNNLIICVSSNADPRNPHAIKFGGFFSCRVGNPLHRNNTKNQNNFIQNVKKNHSNMWPKSCSDGYVAHIATIERGCQISYCTKTNKFSLGPSPDLIKPPFIELSYNPNSTMVMMFSNNKGNTLVKDKSGSWKIKYLEKKSTKNVLIGSVCAVITWIAVVCCGLLFFLRRYRRQNTDVVS